MLRILVISLVVANLLLLGFQSSKPSVKPEARVTPAVVKDSAIPTIHLFSEMVQDQGLMSGNRQCFTLGPFHSSDDRDDVYTRLQEVSTRISERQTEALVEKGYWVFMPPYASMLEANKALFSLQALGLKDIAIIYDGEWKNAISLGYFMRQENAQSRKKALESKGYTPMIRVQRDAEPRYWLDYEQNPGSGLIALDMQNRPNDFMQRPVPCPEADFFEAEEVASQVVTAGDEDAETPTTVVDQPAASAQAKAAETTPDAQKAVDTPPDQDAGDTSAAAVEALPKKAVGTGPEHSVTTDDDSGGQPQKDADNSNDQALPAETEAGSGNGIDKDDSSI